MSKARDLAKSVNLKPKIVEARSVAKDNQRQAERLTADFEKLQERSAAVDHLLQTRIAIAFDSALVPFAEAFAQLKNVDLESPDLLDRVPAVNSASPDTTQVSLGVVKSLVALTGGAALGAGAGAVTFASVAAFATASTGTAIGSLSGAAATSATLAWLGGGSLATGGMGMAGGMMVLAAAVAVPAVLALGGFMSWRGRKELAKQREDAAELKAARAQYRVAERLVTAVEARAADMQETLTRLSQVMIPLNGWLAHMVSTKPDYREFTSKEKDKLAGLVGVATAMATVMQAPLIATDGTLNEEHADLMADARKVADAR